MPLVTVALLLASASTAVGDAQKPNLFPIGLSFAAPAIFETCKKIDPEHAEVYDLRLNAWLGRNHQSFEQLRPILEKQLEEDGVSTLEHVKQYASSTVVDFNKMTPDRQLPGCSNIIAYINNN